MDEVREATETLLEEKPEADAALEELLRVGEAEEPFTFADLTIDSGLFGEIVSRGIVEKTDGEYRVADRRAVRAALDDDDDVGRFLNRPSVTLKLRNGRRRWPHPRTVGGLVGALAFLGLMRILHVRSVFREDHVISPANDPYFYRYWTDQLLAISTDPTDLEVFRDLPSGAIGTRPYAHAMNWWVTALLGGDQWAADMTAAWLPVVATLLLGVVVFWTGRVLTGDVRVGLAAVFILALAPVHAVYSGLGFLEHRLHQYFWLGVTVLGVAWLGVDLARRIEGDGMGRAIRGHLISGWSWIAAGGIALGLALSMHAWGGSILMLLPIAAYVPFRVVLDVRHDVRPAIANLPLLIGIAGGGLLAGALHLRWGWHESFVAYLPAAVVAGTLLCVIAGELWRIGGWRLEGLLAIQLLGGGIAIWAFRREFRPEWDRLIDRSEDLFFREGATETVGLFEDFDLLLGPVFQIGVDFFLGLFVLGWAGLYVWRTYAPGWLAVVAYGVVWLVLAAIQSRFAAQLTVVWAIFGGFGLVYLLSWVDLARRPRPLRAESGDPRTTENTAESDPIRLPESLHAGVYIVGILLIVSGMSLIFVPTLSAEAQYDDDRYEALQAIEEDVAAFDREYPENFVFSEWGHSRMYNYFINGEARSYSYARSNFADFVFDSDADEWFGEFNGSVGYVVIPAIDNGPPVETVQQQLHADVDVSDGVIPDVAHFQLIMSGEEVTTYAVVEGATITANASIEAESAQTTVEFGDDSAHYVRPFSGGNETVQTTVAYPGTYEIGDTTVTVTEADVRGGEVIEVGG